MSAGGNRCIRNVEKSEKTVPFVTSDRFFGQDVSELVLGVDVFHLDNLVKVDPVKQPKCNSVGARSVSHCRTSAFNNRLDYCFIVIKDVQ